jgi:predicted DNA binding protein
VRLSYPKALDTLVAEFKRVNMNDPERRARQVLDPLLTDRQREALRG